MLVVEKEKVIMDYFKFDGAEIEVVSAVNRYGTLPIRYYDDLNLSPKAWGILGKIFLLKISQRELENFSKWISYSNKRWT